jgi:hypothetical protein
MAAFKNPVPRPNRSVRQKTALICGGTSAEASEFAAKLKKMGYWICVADNKVHYYGKPAYVDKTLLGDLQNPKFVNMLFTRVLGSGKQFDAVHLFSELLDGDSDPNHNNIIVHNNDGETNRGIKVHNKRKLYSVPDKMENYLLDKRVILIGPGGSVNRDCKDIDVDSYDVVVRLNWHWRNAKTSTGNTGKRTDIVCHCINEDQINQNDLIRFREENIKLLLRNERSTSKAKNFNMINRDIDFDDIHTIPDFLLKSLKLKIDGTNPSTGVLCIVYLLNQDIKSLDVVGFDFYKTLYFRHRDKELLSQIRAGEVGDHHPDIQLEYMKSVFKNNPKLNAIGALNKIISS